MVAFVSTIPVLLAFAVAYLLHLIRQAQMRRSSAVYTGALLGVAILFPLFFDMVLMKHPKNMQQEMRAAANLTTLTRKGETAISDAPQVVAWYADRPAIWIPANEVRIRDIRQKYDKYAHWLFLTDNVRRYGEEWIELQSTLQQWNMGYARARESNVSAPAPVTILPEYAIGNPFLQVLVGYTSVEPVKGGVTVIVAKSDGPAPAALSAPPLNPPESGGK